MALLSEFQRMVPSLLSTDLGTPSGAPFEPWMMDQPSSFYGGLTPRQFLQQQGVTDFSNPNTVIPDPKPGSLMPDSSEIGGFLLAAAPLAAMVGGAAGVGGLSNMAGSGLSGLGGVGAESSMSGFGFGSPESLVGMEGASGGLGYSGQGLSSLGNLGGGGGDFTQLASDAGDEVAWSSQGFQPTMTDDVGGGGFFGGIGSFLSGISPNTWANLAGTALGAGAGLFAQNKAVDAQTQAANNALALQAQMYQQNRADLEPWRNAGVGALNQINAQMPEFTRRFGMADYQQDPGYQFRLSEGEKAINRAAQARGLYDSGATMKALDKYNSNMASQEYGQAYNRFTQDQTNAYNKLSNLAGMGQTSAQQVASLGGQYANQAGDIGLQAGNARASGYIGGANTLANALNQGITQYNQSQQLPYLRNYINYV